MVKTQIMPLVRGNKQDDSMIKKEWRKVKAKAEAKAKLNIKAKAKAKRKAKSKE